jgi:hypothetical protein
MGSNLMNPRRREQVLNTALTTAAATLSHAIDAGRSAA